MKKIMMLWMVACLAGCSYFVSMDELARNIQTQMQHEFNSNRDYQHYRFTVKKVKIVQRQGNEFQAISHLNYQGEEYPIHVKVFKVDGGIVGRLKMMLLLLLMKLKLKNIVSNWIRNYSNWPQPWMIWNL
ncbi:hypothetical protein NI464_09260 [Acinetobacter lwoffii]|nr:hypothetical protein [Acinetobacter lwoffii]MCO8085564.1 hypothetical protein [Acinetobacter lwoffii]